MQTTCLADDCLSLRARHSLLIFFESHSSTVLLTPFSFNTWASLILLDLRLSLLLHIVVIVFENVFEDARHVIIYLGYFLI